MSLARKVQRRNAQALAKYARSLPEFSLSNAFRPETETHMAMSYDDDCTAVRISNAFVARAVPTSNSTTKEELEVSGATVIPVDNTRARRLDNLTNAKLYLKAGLYLFPSSGKTPLVPRFNRIDKSLTPEEREAAIEEFREKHEGQDPVHVGATNDPAVLKKMFKAHMDCVWSIACGPSKLVVIDADEKDNGPELIGKHFAEHGLPEGCVVVPTQGGGRHYIFSDPDGKFTNSAGALKSAYGCDVRGAGGQYISPGMIREDGKTYGTKFDARAFYLAYQKGTLPQLPDHVVDLIGRAGGAAKSVAESEFTPFVRELEQTDWPDQEELFDPAIGTYDIDALKAKSPEFAEAFDNAPEDKSTARWQLSRTVLELVSMPVTHLAVLYDYWGQGGVRTEDGKGSGNYGLRDIAKEWYKNRDRYRSNGAAMGAVEVDEKAEYLEAHGNVIDFDSWYEGIQAERAERAACVAAAGLKTQSEVAQPVSKEEQAKRFVYIENIRGTVLRAVDWCIKFFVARGTTSVATGLWGTGKTAVFSDVGLHVGHGFEWRGRKVTKGVVIYVALENSEDVERRVAAWCELMERAGRDVSGGAFVVHRGPCSLFDPTGKPTRDEKVLIEIANTAAEHYGLPVAMIVIDTLAQSIMPGNDNDAKDAGIYTAAMQRIVAATGANVTALAHPTKSGEGVRGSGALQANVDTVIEVSRDGAGQGSIKAGSKFRIGNPAKVKFGYRLRSHSMGQDADGDDIDVVLAAEDAAVAVNLAVNDSEEDVAALTPPDTPADKLAAMLRAFKARVEHLSEATGEAAEKVGLTAKEMFAALNQDRRVNGLPELKDRTIVSRLLGRLAEGGEIVKSGDNRRTEYRVSSVGKQKKV